MERDIIIGGVLTSKMNGINLENGDETKELKTKFLHHILLDKYKTKHIFGIVF
jgi:hypothetical protein